MIVLGGIGTALVLRVAGLIPDDVLFGAGIMGIPISQYLQHRVTDNKQRAIDMRNHSGIDDSDPRVKNEYRSKGHELTHKFYQRLRGRS